MELRSRTGALRVAGLVTPEQAAAVDEMARIGAWMGRFAHGRPSAAGR